MTTPTPDPTPRSRSQERRSVLAPLAGLGLLALFLADAAWAAVGPVGESGMAGGRARVRARLVADVDAVPAGGSARLGIHYEMDPGWHMYWRNPGDTGLATELAWSAPGVEVQDVDWPVPEVFTEGDIFTAYGYEDEVLLAADARFSPALVSQDRVRVEVTTRFLVCEIQCVPGEITLRREFPVLAAGEFPTASVDAGLFADARKQYAQSASERDVEVALTIVPEPLEAGSEFTGSLAVLGCPENSDATGCGPMSGSGAGAPLNPRALFVPYEGLPFEFLESTGLESGDGVAYRVAFKGLVEEKPTERRPGEAARMRGLLAFSGAEDSRGAEHWLEVDLAVPLELAAAPPPAVAPPKTAANSPSPAPTREAGLSWLRILGLALLGGLVLNLMPCVLPVLAIKVFALTELAHSGRGEALRQGGAYTAGVVLSMLVLAAAVAGLRGAGHAVGWGFQFQEPRFVATLAVVLVVFSLNLMGVFEITFGGGRLASVGADSNGARRSFFEGLLAVVLATPCSAPFLATATGFAFAGSVFDIFAVFAAVGVGLAAPFALIALVPGLARFLPQPGNWMVHLRSGLGFLVLASVIWLLWIAGQTLGNDGVTTLLALLLLVSAACWLFGLIQRSGNPTHSQRAAIALTVASLVAVVAVPLDGEPAPSAGGNHASRSAALSGELPALPFDRDDVAQSVASGKPTFVYFTADWCITCKLNERRVLADERVQTTLAERGYQIFRGDWTRRDDAIREELARHGRAGVPLYLVYRGGRADLAPQMLPELLGVDDTIAALESAAPKGSLQARR